MPRKSPEREMLRKSLAPGKFKFGSTGTSDDKDDHGSVEGYDGSHSRTTEFESSATGLFLGISKLGRFLNPLDPPGPAKWDD